MYPLVVIVLAISQLGSSWSQRQPKQPSWPPPLVRNSRLVAECGRYSAPSSPVGAVRPHTRIVGGQNVTSIDEVPWQVALNATRKEGGANVFCGGSIISKRLILTAAHCLVNVTSISIRVASLYYNLEGQVLTTNETLVHPAYNATTQMDDIGLVVLASPFVFNFVKGQAPQPICLPWDYSELYGQDCNDQEQDITFDDGFEQVKDLHIVGWGRESLSAASLAPILQQIDLEPVNERVCFRLYRLGVDPLVDLLRQRPRILCAYGVDEAICLGDSGGGLYHSWNDRRQMRDRAIVVGIASLTFACGQSNVPDIYTRVSKYYNWIKWHLNRTGGLKP